MKKIDRRARQVMAGAVAEICRRSADLELSIYAQMEFQVANTLATRIERNSNLRVVVNILHKYLVEDRQPLKWRQFFVTTDFVEVAYLVGLYKEML